MKKLLLLLLCVPLIGLGQNLTRQQISEFLESHNKYRIELGLPQLVWSKRLSNNALKWGLTLQKNNCNKINGTRHSTDTTYGENIAWNSGFNETPKGVVDRWAKGKEFFVYSTFPDCCTNRCGHYTQIIWKATKKVGCAFIQCGNEQVWICQYDPPGNYIGKKVY